jgi:aldose 1-epimerase
MGGGDSRTDLQAGDAWRHEVALAMSVTAPALAPSRDNPSKHGGPSPALSAVALVRSGQRDAKEIKTFTLANGTGMVAKITNYGAILMDLLVPDRNGKPVDVVLGLDRPEEYAGDQPHLGATVGRVANRIAGASFTLDGKEYPLAKNDGPNSLHGGLQGFDKHVWEVTQGEGADGWWVSFRRQSLDGEEGYPGNVEAVVTYRLTRKNELVIEMSATTDRPTLVNLAHHSYWNLGGHASGKILDQELQLFADAYTPRGTTGVPKGTIEPVAGTPYDFTRPKKIGQDLVKTGGDPVGYDVNFVVRGKPGELRPVARASDPGTGIVMEVSATEPGVQLYTSNFMDGTLKGKGGVSYARHGAFCLETQKYPDAIHHPEWPSPVLRPGERYHHVMVHRFSTASPR